MQDLFQDHSEIPVNVRTILEKYDLEQGDYSILAACLAELEKIGYTYEYYLDSTPYNLHKINDIIIGDWVKFCTEPLTDQIFLVKDIRLVNGETRLLVTDVYYIKDSLQPTQEIEISNFVKA